MRVAKGLLGLLLAMPLLASAEEIGQVSTVFKFVGPNDRIVVEAFDDPESRGRDLLPVPRQDGRGEGWSGVG